MHATVTGLQARVDELEPGIIDARAQLSETQKLVNEAKVDLGIVVDDLNLIETELDSDVRNSSKVKDNHTHKLPRAVTEKAKRVSQGGKTSKSLESKNKAKAQFGQSLEDAIEEQVTKKSFWKRIFRRKNRGSA
jgi:ABC-type transporter Mla subunit MlaD